MSVRALVRAKVHRSPVAGIQLSAFASVQKGSRSCDQQPGATARTPNRKCSTSAAAGPAVWVLFLFFGSVGDIYTHRQKGYKVRTPLAVAIWLVSLPRAIWRCWLPSALPRNFGYNCPQSLSTVKSYYKDKKNQFLLKKVL